MKRTGIKIIFLGAVAFIGWQLGGVVPPSALTLALGVLFGSMVGIPIALIALTTDRRVRHDHYHHVPADLKPQSAQLPARPTRYIVVENRPSLPVVTQNKIEVKQ